MDLQALGDKSHIILPGRHPCDCEASYHDLLNNCLNCGRIICAQEGYGECFTCKTPITMQVKEQELNTVKEKTYVSLKDIAAFLGDPNKENSDKLKVIDDQNDYFHLESENWISPNQRLLAQRECENLSKNKFAKDIKFSIDIENRRITETVTPKLNNFNQLVDDLKEKLEFKSDYNFINAKSIDLNEPLPCLEYQRDLTSITNEQKIDSCKLGTIFSNSLLQIQEEMGSANEGLCLSVQQPFASFIINGIKLHEGRSWGTQYRGRLWIHAAAKIPNQETINTEIKRYSVATSTSISDFPKEYPTSVLLGFVELEECLSEQSYIEKYAEGYVQAPYVWIFSKPHYLSVKIAMIGKSNRLFLLDRNVYKAASSQFQSLKIKKETF